MSGASDALVGTRSANTVLGVVRSVAPAQRRTDRLEPWLRLAVPILVAVFLLTLGASAWLQMAEGRRTELNNATADLELVASVVVAGLAAGLQPDARRYDTPSLGTERVAAALASHDVLAAAGWDAVHARAAGLAATLATVPLHRGRLRVARIAK